MNRTELPPFEHRLLSELSDVVEERRRVAEPTEARHQRRTPRPRLAAVLGGVAVVAVALSIAPGLTRDGGSAAFAIRELPNGVIEVDYATDFRDGRALEAELRSFGVDVRIVAVPSSPSAVGAVHGLEVGASTETPGLTWGPDGGTLAFSIDPEVFQDDITLHLSVDAEPGERYELSEEVFEPGEVLGGLHCALGEPLRAADVAPYLDELGLTATWILGQPVPGEPDSLQDEVVDDVPDGEVLWGYATDDASVELTVVADGVNLSEHWQPRLSDAPCTAEQAASWD